MHSIITLSLVLLSASVAAQPTLQIADLPTSTTLNWYLLTDPGSITEPSDGIGQTWDFTSATWSLAGTVSFGPAAGTPYAAQYPAANYVFVTTPTGGSSIYAYLLVDANSLEVICGDAPMSTEVYTDYKTVMQTPLAYGGAFTDANDGTQGPDAETWTYTGAGTLLTDLGDFANTVKTVRTDDDRITLWNSSPLFPRITGNSQSVNLYTDAQSSVAERATSSTPLVVFPNVAVDDLTVKAVGAGSKWTIADTQGRVMQSGSFTGQGDQRLNLSGLSIGTYVLQVTDATGTRVAHFQKA